MNKRHCQVNENNKDTAPWSTQTPQMPSATCGKGPHSASSNSSSRSPPYSHQVASELCSHKVFGERGELEQSKGAVGLYHHAEGGGAMAGFFLLGLLSTPRPEAELSSSKNQKLIKEEILTLLCMVTCHIINISDGFSLKSLSGQIVL